MKKNMGTADRVVRTFIAVLLGVLYFQGILTGTLATVFVIVAIVFLLTSIISFCPLYRILGISTCRVPSH
jgi:hypothetical protein